MNEVTRFWSYTFYVPAISLFLSLAGLTISIFKWKEKKDLKLLPLFFLSYIIANTIILFQVFTKSVDRPSSVRLTHCSDFFDTIVEFLVFFLLIKGTISKKLQRLMLPLLILFIGLIVAIFFSSKKIFWEIDQPFLQKIYTVEAVVLIICCVLYYIDLFTKKFIIILIKDSCFWVVTGLTFFMLCTLPFSIFGQYLVNADYYLYFQLFRIFEIFYCILFLMIIKGYLCKEANIK
jgi:hypothetical protein